MANKRKRGERWHYTVVRKNLLPKPIYLTFDDEAEGDAYIAQLERVLDAGHVPEEYKSTKYLINTIASAIIAYTDLRDVPESDRLVLKVIGDRKGSTNLGKVSYVWAEAWVNEMKARDMSPSTIRHHVGALARCFDWVENRGDTMLLTNPLRKLPKRYATGHKDEVARDRRLTTEEEAEVIRILKGGIPQGRERGFLLKEQIALNLLFTMAIESGMRLSEMLTLEVSQIDMHKRTIFLDKTKNGDKRQVPMSTVLIAAVKTYLKGHKDEYLMPWRGEPRYLSSKLSGQFHRIFDAAGCSGFTFHGLRHEATCRMYERTRMTDVQIAKCLGWRSLSMALRYANLRASDLSELLW